MPVFREQLLVKLSAEEAAAEVLPAVHEAVSPVVQPAKVGRSQVLPWVKCFVCVVIAAASWLRPSTVATAAIPSYPL